jgi:hypothetical protein
VFIFRFIKQAEADMQAMKAQNEERQAMKTQLMVSHDYVRVDDKSA